MIKGIDLIPFFLFFIYNKGMSFKQKFISTISSKRFGSIFYPIFYIVFAVAIAISGSLIFNKYYYIYIYVSGNSMIPTLFGDTSRSYYGEADTSKTAIDHLNRFDVLIVDYPSDWGTEEGYKVKRLWGFPGETISLTYESGKVIFTATKDAETYTVTGVFHNAETFDFETRTFIVPYYKFSTGNRVFKTYAHIRNIPPHTLKDDEYFVMGDNWSSSTDSYERTIVENKTHLNYSYLRGRVINILGIARYDKAQDALVDKVNFKYPLYRF